MAVPSAGLQPDLALSRLFSHPPGGVTEEALEVSYFAVQIERAPQIVRSHLAITVSNPNERPQEAVLRLPVPPGAAVTRAVLYVGDRPMEGAFVGRERARTIYRSITARRRDPALIAWSGPDWIEVTLFPVEARGQRKLELEWVEPAAVADGQFWYRIPLLAQAGKKIVRPDSLSIDGRPVPATPSEWIALGPGDHSPVAARAPGDPFGFVVAPASDAPAEPMRLVIAAETSRDMTARARRRQRAALDRLLSRLPGNAAVTLMASDWDIEVLAENQPLAAARRVLDKLDAIPSAGALDLERSLLEATERARGMGARSIVFLGHGADAFAGDALAAPIRRMQEAGVALVVVGTDEIAAPMADLASLTGGQAVQSNEVNVALARLFRLARRTGAALSFDGVEDWQPLETVTGEVRWVGRFVGEPPANVAPTGAREAEALWARAHVLVTPDAAGEAGAAHQVLTPLTSILVLENDADYQRWGLPIPAREPEPSAPGDSRDPGSGTEGRMGRGASGRELSGFAREGPRARSIIGQRDPQGSAPGGPPLGNLLGAPPAEAWGSSGLGLSGTGRGGAETGAGKTPALGELGTIGGGYGRSAGRPHASRAGGGDVLAEAAQVHGSLDKDLIRRIIRHHLNELRYCYEIELPKTPDLGGRAEVRFIIGPDGQVASAVIASSTTRSLALDSCVVEAVRRWEFPRPLDGRVVSVQYPFTFASEPGAARSGTARPAPDPWEVALAAFRQRAELAKRLEQVARILAVPPCHHAAVLGWWLVEWRLRKVGAPVAAYVLAALLLEEARLGRDAARVLSESAPINPERIEAEYRSLGRRWDAERLASLAHRR
jgi:TonB family protein